jgi:hypothetical protein
LAAAVVWQRETVLFLADPSRIHINSEQHIRAALDTGDFGPVTEDGGVLIYRVMDGTAEVRAAFSENALQTLEVRFNAYDIPVRSVLHGMSRARELLSPYLSPSAITALGVLLTAEIAVSSGEAGFSRSFGAHSLSVTSDTATGETLAVVGRNQ